MRILPGGRVLQQPDHLSHVRGEAGQILGQILGIPDVRIDFREQGHLRVGTAGRLKPGSDHQGEQPHDLQRHGLSARVRAGDHEHAQRLIQHDIVRHDMLPRQHQERVARLPEGDTAAAVQRDWPALHETAERSLGRNAVQPGQRFQAAQERRCMAGHQR